MAASSSRTIPADKVRADAQPPSARRIRGRSRTRALGDRRRARSCCWRRPPLLEMRISTLQALVFAVRPRDQLGVEPEAGAALRAPDAGPYDTRLGYNRLPGFVERLQTAGYDDRRAGEALAQDGRSGRMGAVPDLPREGPGRALVTDRQGGSLYEARTPERVFESFDAIPPADRQHPALRREPRPPRPAAPSSQPGRRMVSAGQGDRLRHPRPAGTAGRGRSARARSPPRSRSSGTRGRDAPDLAGREAQADALGEPARVSGRHDTLPARRQIVVDYLNSTPLAAAPGYGEVLGLGDGLWAWYGVDRSKTRPSAVRESGALRRRARAQAYRRVLSLLLATRRPYHYLIENRTALEEFTDCYLRVMAQRGRHRRPPARRRARAGLDFRQLEPSAARRLERAQGREPGPRAPDEPARRSRALRSGPAATHRAEHARRPGPGRGGPALSVPA